MSRLFKLLPALLTVAALAACRGGGMNLGGIEAGNPPAPGVRALQGMISADAECQVDTVVVTYTDDITVSQTVDAQACSFSLNVDVEKPFSVSFEKNGAQVGILVSKRGIDPLFANMYLVFPVGEGAVDLGLVSLADGTGLPELEPAWQIDSDGDGISNLDDDDADGNGILDVDEPDCDLDGLWGAFDSDESCEDPVQEPAEPPAKVAEVVPRRNSGIRSRRTAAPIGVRVKARFACAIDPNSVTDATFSVTDEDGESVICDFVLSSADKVVRCEHDVPLKRGTHYEAVLDGIRCQDGRDTQSKTWQWATAP